MNYRIFMFHVIYCEHMWQYVKAKKKNKNKNKKPPQKQQQKILKL